MCWPHPDGFLQVNLAIAYHWYSFFVGTNPYKICHKKNRILINTRRSAATSRPPLRRYPFTQTSDLDLFGGVGGDGSGGWGGGGSGGGEGEGEGGGVGNESVVVPVGREMTVAHLPSASFLATFLGSTTFHIQKIFNA